MASHFLLWPGLCTYPCHHILNTLLLYPAFWFWHGLYESLHIIASIVYTYRSVSKALPTATGDEANKRKMYSASFEVCGVPRARACSSPPQPLSPPAPMHPWCAHDARAPDVEREYELLWQCHDLRELTYDGDGPQYEDAVNAVRAAFDMWEEEE